MLLESKCATDCDIKKREQILSDNRNVINIIKSLKRILSVMLCRFPPFCFLVYFYRAIWGVAPLNEFGNYDDPGIDRSAEESISGGFSNDNNEYSTSIQRTIDRWYNSKEWQDKIQQTQKTVSAKCNAFSQGLIGVPDTLKNRSPGQKVGERTTALCQPCHDIMDVLNDIEKSRNEDLDLLDFNIAP